MHYTFIFIIEISSVSYGNAMEQDFNYVCDTECDFSKLTILCIHVYIFIFKKNKSVLTFFISIKYVSVCVVLHSI